MRNPMTAAKHVRKAEIIPKWGQPLGNTSHAPLESHGQACQGDTLLQLSVEALPHAFALEVPAQPAAGGTHPLWRRC